MKLRPSSLSTSNFVIVGDDDGDLFRIEAKPDSVKVKIRSHTGGGDPDFDLLRIVGGSGLGGGGVVKGGLIAITGDPDFDLLRMSATQDSAKIRLGDKITGDPDFDLLRLPPIDAQRTKRWGREVTLPGRRLRHFQRRIDVKKQYRNERQHDGNDSIASVPGQRLDVDRAFRRRH